MIELEAEACQRTYEYGKQRLHSCILEGICHIPPEIVILQKILKILCSIASYSELPSRHIQRLVRSRGYHPVKRKYRKE